MRNFVLIVFLSMIFVLYNEKVSSPEERAENTALKIGMTKQEIGPLYPKEEERTYRIVGDKEWHTYNYGASPAQAITLYLENKKLGSWEINDRKEIIEEYLGEFCSQSLRSGYPRIYEAIKSVLTRLPWEEFIELTGREHPAVFTEQCNSGSARFANSSEILMLEGDPPTFTEGFFIVKLGTDLEKASKDEAIEGVIAHELAHGFLRHGAKDKYSLKMEKKANELIEKWGFREELILAQKEFK